MKVNKSVLKSHSILIVFLSLVWMAASCSEGMISEETPIHINPSMDMQEKYKTNGKSYFFANGSVNRMPIEGTVATTELFESTEYFYGKSDDGKFVDIAPIEFNDQILTRGKERYSIFCTPCHGEAGDGKGMIVSKEYKAPPDYFTEKIRSYPDGQLFDIISIGFKNMPAYNHQIPVQDRWAIVGHVRYLQRMNPEITEDTSTQKNDIPAAK